MRKSQRQYGRVVSAATNLRDYLHAELASAAIDALTKLIGESVSSLDLSAQAANVMVYTGVQLVERSQQTAKTTADQILVFVEQLQLDQEQLLLELEDMEPGIKASTLLAKSQSNQKSLEMNTELYQVSMVGHDLLAVTVDATIADSLNAFVKLLSQRPGDFDFVGVLSELATEASSRVAREIIDRSMFPQYAFLTEAISPFVSIVAKFRERRKLSQSANEFLRYFDELSNSLSQWRWAAQSMITTFNNSLPRNDDSGEGELCQT